MKDNNSSLPFKTAKLRISWLRRLKNYWVSHNQNTLHISLGILFLCLSAVGALIRSTSGMEASALPLRLERIGFWGLFLVLLLAFLHMNLHGADRFLHHFRDTSNLPVGQMRQVAFFCMLTFLAAAAVCMTASAFALPHLGTWIASLFSGRASASPEPEAVSVSGVHMDTPDLSALAEEAGAAPAWLPVLEAVMNAAALAIAAALALALFWQAARRICEFLTRKQQWDDDEKVYLTPSLLPLASPDSEKPGAKRRILSVLRPASYRDAIRKEYRKVIRRGLRTKKLSAAPGASPSELEAAAGCRDDRMHQAYEKARYSSAECTGRDLDAMRRASSPASAGSDSLAKNKD